jgi:threonylcarbamoyladenosine tRNA methylthiotransferase MtaB
MHRSYLIKTLGCKANLYDSQLIEAELLKAGWTPAQADQGADLCIINSCTVTDEADRQSRKTASRLFRENPNAKVVITGCGAEVDPERLTKSAGIHYVVGNQDKPKLVELILKRMEAPGLPQGEILGGALNYQQMISQHPQDREWPAPEASFWSEDFDPSRAASTQKTRAFLKIQEGCNAFCTYCVIPYGRGPSRSLDLDSLVRQVQSLVSQGVRELVLTGTNIGDYGSDWVEPGSSLDRKSGPFVELLKRILQETELYRLRLSSLDPTEITPELTKLVEENPLRLCPHFHVSLQSPHAKILRLMKRRYSEAEVRECLNRIAEIKTPSGFPPFVGMDLITGFPGETQEIYEETRALLKELPWTRLHVFPYSERAGTPATRLPESVPRDERLRRSRELNDLSVERMKEQALQRLQRPLDHILLESPSEKELSRNIVSGYSADYWRVRLTSHSLATAGSQSWGQNQSLTQVVAESVEVDPVSREVTLIARSVDLGVMSPATSAAPNVPLDRCSD